MRSGYFFGGIIFVALFTVLLVLFASGILPPSTVTQINPSSEVRREQAEQVNAQVNAPVAVTVEPSASQAAKIHDGLAIQKKHCSRCHATAWINQIEKPRTEWQEVLARMEAMGVHLSDAEKDVLLNYLAGSKSP